ncbi:hypothetical protein G9C98_005046 [Cotesia typhae]|uniref:Lipoma HMGIC fusion partner-like 2 protein n=1 Tax=Cotesia typhae TaxID=2053667 RepID=A0A8J5R9V1_9HYME|nr:hypothetical protein G9C98_005046 [Cotesia typhae]
MCYVIVTGRSLLWSLLSLVALMAVFSALITPKWIVGPPKTKDTQNGTELYTPTAGIFNRCTMLFNRIHCANFNIDGLATDSNVFPGCWKASLFFLALGLSVMALTVFAALLGCCWAFYSAAIGVALTFVCAILSAQAEKSTASDKVQDKMNEGKTLICLA